jgi:hypothetical protein
MIVSSEHLAIPQVNHPCHRTSPLSMSEIQNVAIVSHEVKKDEAKPFVTYNVKGSY